jgi:hypothetical protein
MARRWTNKPWRIRKMQSIINNPENLVTIVFRSNKTKVHKEDSQIRKIVSLLFTTSWIFGINIQKSEGAIKNGNLEKLTKLVHTIQDEDKQTKRNTQHKKLKWCATRIPPKIATDDGYYWDETCALNYITTSLLHLFMIWYE